MAWLLFGLAAAEGLGSFLWLLRRPLSPEPDVAAWPPAVNLSLIAATLLGTAFFTAMLVKSWRDRRWAFDASQRAFGDARTVPYVLLSVAILVIGAVGAVVYLWPDEVLSLNRARLERVASPVVWIGLLSGQLAAAWIWLHRRQTLSIASRAFEPALPIILFGVSLAVRLPMTGYALPYQSVWDEVVTYPQAMRMLTVPGLHQVSNVPGYGSPAYGDLLVYVTAAGEALGLIDGFRTQEVSSIHQYVSPPKGVHSIYEAVHVSGIPLRYPRVLLATINSLAPVAIFLILRRQLQVDRWLAFGGGVIYALLSRDVIYYSSYILPDALATTLFLFLVLAAFEGMSDAGDRLFPWAACAALTGMVVSVTIRDLPVVAVPLAAFVLAQNHDRPYTKLATIGIGVFAGFAVTSPYAFLDLPAYLLKITSFTWQQDWSGVNRLTSLVYYFQGAFASGFDSGYVDSTEGSVGLGALAGLLALIGLARGLALSPRKILLIMAFAALHMVSISSVIQRFTRHALIVYPLVCLLAGSGMSLAATAIGRGLNRWRDGAFASWSKAAPPLVLIAFLVFSGKQMVLTLRYVQRVGQFEPSQVRAADYLEARLRPGDKVAILDQIPWVEADLVRRGISFERVQHTVALPALRAQGFTYVVGTDRFGGDYQALSNSLWDDYYSVADSKLAEFGNLSLQYQGYPNGSLYLFVGRVPGSSP